MAAEARVQASGSLRLAGAGALAYRNPSTWAQHRRCARRDATTFCPNTFSESSNQSEIRNELDCYRCHNPP